ncbi:MAG: hypothetical protein OXH52_11005 [Gammaproteobacteria bacterium]|nr:hypothetical protein [Gammaproteobacteria bacterium]
MQGLSLRDGLYRPLPAFAENGVRTIRSRVLDLDLCVENEVLRFREQGTGEYLHNNLAEATRALTEANAARLAAETRIAELEAQLRR